MLRKDGTPVIIDFERAVILAYGEDFHRLEAMKEESYAYGTQPYMPRGPHAILAPPGSEEQFVASFLRSPRNDIYAMTLTAIMVLSPPMQVLYDDGGEGGAMLPTDGIPRVQVMGNLLPDVKGLGEGSTADAWEREMRLGSCARLWFKSSFDPAVDGYHLMTVKVAELMAANELEHINPDLALSCPTVHAVFSSASAPEPLASKVRLLLAILIRRGSSPLPPRNDFLSSVIDCSRKLMLKFPPALN